MLRQGTHCGIVHQGHPCPACLAVPIPAAVSPFTQTIHPLSQHSLDHPMSPQHLLLCSGTEPSEISPSPPSLSGGGISKPRRAKLSGIQTLTSYFTGIFKLFSKPCFGLEPFSILKRKIIWKLRLIKIQNSTTPAKTTLLVLGWFLWLPVRDESWLGLGAEWCGHCLSQTACSRVCS